MDKAIDSVETAQESTSSNEQKRSSVEHQTSIFSQVSSLHSHSLMSNSQFAQVVFHDLDDVYPTDSDLHCRYTLTDTVQHTHGDRIALYKVGWKFVTDFVVFKLAPMPLSEKEYSTLRVAFSANTLPKDEAEWYQLCYVTADNMVIGASIPFEFRRPHESILKAIEDKSNPGLMVYKSRIALLHDKLANIEELKELSELKVYTLSNQISVLEKEVSSVTSLNKDLKQSLDHAKEDVDLLTKNLKCLNDEYNEVKSLNSKREGELKVYIDEINRLKASLDEKDTALSNLKSKLPSLEQFIVNNNKEKEELKASNIECEHLRNAVEEKEKEFKALQSEFNSLKQENVHSNLKLQEITNYNFRVKNDIDSLKEDNETLRAAKEIQHKLIDELANKLQNVKQQRDNLLASAAAAAHSSTAPSESTNKMDSSEREYLQKQIRQLTELLEETLENQPLYEEDQKTYMREIKSKLEAVSQERRAHENEVCELNSIIKKQNDHIQKSNDELKHFIGLRDKNENDFKYKIEELRTECRNITKINENLFKRIRDLEQVERKFKELSDENNQLKSRLSNSEQCSGCSSGNINEINELKDVIKSLKEALVTEPCFEQFCKILFESTRVNAMSTYKDLYDSAQFVVFENPEIGFKVQRLLDEFGILKQDLDRRRQENENVLKELSDKNDELRTITLENESNKNKLVELKEVKDELENCLIAVKKENGNQIDGSKPVSDVTCHDHFEQIKKLTDDLALTQIKNHELQRQLKETKIQSALNNVGRISALSNQQSADNEVEVLKRRIKELEEERTVGAPQKCCEMLQQRLNVSKIEYAKLYRRLASDKSHYESLISNILGQASASPTTSSSSVAPAPTGSS